MLKPPIEVRRGILLLTGENVSYLGTPPVQPTTATASSGPVGAKGGGIVQGGGKVNGKAGDAIQGKP
jgi:hypothetical protein